MKKTFQSFVFGCRVNEAERIKMDSELIRAGFSVDLASPSFIIINTCAITGKAEREARQLITQLKRKYPEAKIVITGCSATLWEKYKTNGNLADIIVPNEQKSQLISLLQTSEVCEAKNQPQPSHDKFRFSNRLLVKIQDGCHRFCSYCIVPYLRGNPQSQRIIDIVSYINSFTPTPSEVVLSAINTESFGKDTGESLIDLIKAVLKNTTVQRIAFGSIHPWSLTDEFIEYYRKKLAYEDRFIHFFHVPLQSGSQSLLKLMRREYDINEILSKLDIIQNIRKDALIASDIIVGYLGETDKLFKETEDALARSVISRLHVFRFSNRAHTAAYYLRKQYDEPTAQEKKKRSEKLLVLSKMKMTAFTDKLIGLTCGALVINNTEKGVKILLQNHVEGIIPGKNALPGQLMHVTILAAKDGTVVCKES
ncbi:MAG: MiaB/RimO family radical SAM methylthiotransferase [Microgenomates group bacterium]